MIKKTPKTKPKKKANSRKKKDTKTPFQEEVVIVGHLVKYNLYLLCKSIIFSSILSKNDCSVEDAAKLANLAISELDLVGKPKES